jgi:ribosome-binding factor A
MRAKKPYHKRKPTKQQIEQLCGSAWPDDGLDPRYDVRGFAIKPAGRKALQLCNQVKHALEDALASECRDPVLQDLSVVAVEPAGGGRLLVKLGRPTGADAEIVTVHLTRAAGKLRCAVAAAITRRKVPELAYCLIDADPQP